MSPPVDSDPTTGVPAPPIVSPPDGRAPPTPGPPTADEGAARLVSRIDVNGYATGAIQVFCEGAWGAVCTSNFDDVDATVACRQLGFASGVRQPQSRTFRSVDPDPAVAAPFVLENLGCDGTEGRLVDCPVFDEGTADRDFSYSFRDYTNSAICDPFAGTFAQVACGTSTAAEEGELRLANGVIAADGSAEYGRLEIFHAGGWGTICDNAGVNRFRRRPDFNAGAATVACRQLGYQQGFQIQKLEDDDEGSTARVPIVLAGSQCAGTEPNLSACPNFELGRVGTTCRHDADVHVVCHSGPNPEMDGTTRLVDGTAGTGYEYGRLEVFLRGFWSNVCNNDRFTPDAAQVACKAFGYDGGAALRFTQSYAESLSQVLFENLPVALAGVDCDGDETTIAECQNNDGLIGMCTNITSSTVLACGNTAAGCDRQDGTAEGSVRLRGGFGTPCDPIHSGFIEVLHFDEWGSICTDQFSENRAEDNLVADVVCRQLGFPHGTRVDPLTARPPPPVDEDAAPSPYSTYYYSYFYDYTAAEEAEEPVDRYWLSSVMCNGPEARLIDCDLGRGFRNNNAGCRFRPNRIHIACRQFPVVEALEEITTPDAVEGDLRLIEEEPIANWVTGRLQVFFEGSWSQVCAGNFDAADADVACRQLGFGAGTVVPQFLSEADRVTLRSTPVFPEIAITSSGCIGTEERLLDCSRELDTDFFFSRDCLNSNGLGLVIGCVATPDSTATEAEYRLSDITPGATPESESGVLEVFHAGAWGTLCRGDFGILESTADIACREMGFAAGFFEPADRSSALLPPWLSGVRCAGPEAEVAACRRSGFGETSTCGAIQRLFCQSSNQANGQVRLVEGRTDAGGAWEYGRLEVLINSIWSIVDDRFRDFGRRGAQVACRTLGFATGAQILVGESSPLPAPRSDRSLIRDVTCEGSEPNLAACAIDTRDYYANYYDYSNSDVFQQSVALVCTTPSDCAAPASSPAEGDLRLVPLNGTGVATAACDDVHFGGVELFRQGRWGRICNGRFGRDEDEFTVDAQVVCRQLGFPFGTVMDEEEVRGAYDSDYDYSSPTMLTWASEVVCTGKEERLLDCDFPQNFGDDYSSRYSGYYDYYGFYNENWPAPAHAEPQPAPMESAPPPSSGLRRSGRCGRTDMNRLAVVCRSFEITESDFIKR